MTCSWNDSNDLVSLSIRVDLIVLVKFRVDVNLQFPYNGEPTDEGIVRKFYRRITARPLSTREGLPVKVIFHLVFELTSEVMVCCSDSIASLTFTENRDQFGR